MCESTSQELPLAAGLSPEFLLENPEEARRSDNPRLARVLGLGTAIALVVGNVIGSGIFVKPGPIAVQLGDFGTIVLVWVVGGVLCVLGGLCFAELASLLPGAGGLYVYLRRAFGPMTGFLFGWNEVLFNKPASTGALAVVFADSFARALGRPLNNVGISIGAISVVLSLAVLNALGVHWGGLVQRLTTGVKAAFVAAIGIVPFAMTIFGFDAVHFQNYASTAPVPADASWGSRFGVALLSVMWAYNGWHNVTPVAEEIRKPRRNMVKALLGGIGIIALLYISANVAYHGVLSMEEVVAAGDHAAEHMLAKIWGTTGATVMAAVIVCSVFGTINSDMLIVPRVSYALGRDGLAHARLADVHHRYRTPVNAILFHGVLTSLIIVATAACVEFMPGLQQNSIFDLLTNFVIFTASVFYALAAGAVFVLRRKRIGRRRTFQAWGYPWTPLAFIVTYAWFLSVIYMARPFEAHVGIGLILLGIPVYWYLRKRPQSLVVGPG